MSTVFANSDAPLSIHSMQHLEDPSQEAPLNCEPAPLLARESVKEEFGSARQLFTLPSRQEITATAVATVESSTINNNVALFGPQPYRRMKPQAESGLPKHYRSQIKKMKISKTSQCCSICQQPYQKDEIISQLPCRHIFHRVGCISEWLKCSVNCPICKMDLYEHLRNEQKEEQL